MIECLAIFSPQSHPDTVVPPYPDTVISPTGQAPVKYGGSFNGAGGAGRGRPSKGLRPTGQAPLNNGFINGCYFGLFTCPHSVFRAGEVYSTRQAKLTTDDAAG